MLVAFLEYNPIKFLRLFGLLKPINPNSIGLSLQVEIKDFLNINKIAWSLKEGNR